MTSTPKFKGVTVEFANGERLVVPPLTLGMVEMMQDRLESFAGGIDKESVSLVVDAALMALRRNYPELTREKLTEELLDLGNMEDVMLAVMDVSGMRRKEQEKGEAQPGQG